MENIVLEVSESTYVQGTRTKVPIDMEPKQRTSIYAPLHQKSNKVPKNACPLEISLNLRVDDNLVAHQKVRMLCRELHDRITFVYIDFDGSPQIAAAKFPKIQQEYGNQPGCPKDVGCAVYFATKGMDVTAQRQVDALQPKSGMWILAPHARGTHSFNWQGPGFWRRCALEVLKKANRGQSSQPRSGNSVAREPYRVLLVGIQMAVLGPGFSQQTFHNLLV